MVEDADESMRGRRFAGVDLAADKVERPLEPRDLQERIVVGGIDVAALSSRRMICCTRRTLKVSDAAMARIECPPIRRAKMRRARACALRRRNGRALGGRGHWALFRRRNGKHNPYSGIQQGFVEKLASGQKRQIKVKSGTAVIDPERRFPLCSMDGRYAPDCGSRRNATVAPRAEVPKSSCKLSPPRRITRVGYAKALRACSICAVISGRSGFWACAVSSAAIASRHRPCAANAMPRR